MSSARRFPDPVRPGVWWRADSRWIRYAPPLEITILDAAARGDETLFFTIPRADGDQIQYKLNLLQLRQVNTVTGYEREIRINKKKSSRSDSNNVEVGDDVGSERKGLSQREKLLKAKRVPEELLASRHTLLTIMGETKGMSAWIDGLLQSEKMVLQCVRRRCSHRVTGVLMATPPLGLKSNGKFHSKFVDKIICLNRLYPSFLDELSIRGLLARGVGAAEVEEAESSNGILRYVFFGCPQKHMKRVFDDGLEDSALERKAEAELFGLDDVATLPFVTTTDGSCTYPTPGIYELLLFLAFLPPGTLSPATQGKTKTGSTSYNILYCPAFAPVAIVRLSVD